MGKPKSPPLTKVVLGIITGEPELWKMAIGELPWGKPDSQSELIDFTFSNYYKPEMGTDLARLWLSFDLLLPADRLADLKTVTNSIEQRLLNSNRGRRFNLDPGIVSVHNLILATTKPAAHRIYLRAGIYAEVTLVFHHQTFEPLPWTYPDYRTPQALRFFLQVRERLVALTRQESSGDETKSQENKHSPLPKF